MQLIPLQNNRELRRTVYRFNADILEYIKPRNWKREEMNFDKITKMNPVTMVTNPIINQEWWDYDYDIVLS